MTTVGSTWCGLLVTVEKRQPVRAQLEPEKGEALRPTHPQRLADPAANRMRVGNDVALTSVYTVPAATSEDGLRVAVGLPCVPRLPRQLRWPRHPGRACHERDMLASYPEPRRSLGSAS